MLLHPHDWSLAQQIDRVLDALEPELAAHVTAGDSQVGAGAGDRRARDRRIGDRGAARPAHRARARRSRMLGLEVASAGTHPFTVWHETVVSGGSRYQAVYGSMRELGAPGAHVRASRPCRGAAPRGRDHAGQRRCAATCRCCSRCRRTRPSGRAATPGLASARTPLFQAFPRVGIPRAFADYEDYVAAVDLLIRCDAFPEPTFLWWDVRPQPRFGTVEVRIMDAQTTVSETGALAALVQSIARLEVEQGYLSPLQLNAPEVLDENRFLAARDGVAAELIDVASERRLPIAAAAGRAARGVAAARPRTRLRGRAGGVPGHRRRTAGNASDRGRPCLAAAAAGARARAGGSVLHRSAFSHCAERHSTKGRNRRPEISDRCPKTWRLLEPSLASVP